MLIDPSHFEVTRALQAMVDVIQREAATVPPEFFDNCPHEGLYNHGWRVFPLRVDHWPYPCDFERNRSFMPETDRVLSRFSQIGCAAISRLEPGCRIIPHNDNPPANSLRGHLSLRLTPGVRMRLGGRDVEWQPGQFQVFDTSIEHEVTHDGDAPRDVFLVDFITTEDERASIRRLEAEEPTA